MAFYVLLNKLSSSVTRQNISSRNPEKSNPLAELHIPLPGNKIFITLLYQALKNMRMILLIILPRIVLEDLEIVLKVFAKSMGGVARSRRYSKQLRKPAVSSILQFRSPLAKASTSSAVLNLETKG